MNSLYDKKKEDLKNGISHLECARAILAAKIRQQSANGNTSLNQADKDGNTALHYAAMNGITEIVSDMLSAHVLKNKTNQLGCTPLMLAAKNGHDAVVELLLDALSDHNAADHENRTALFYSVLGVVGVDF